MQDRFGRYAVLFQMLSYTAWHLVKPLPELSGTLLWGFATAAVTLRARSVWYVFIAHWLLNIFMDTMVLFRQGVL
jgi:membrane protease YdiL (CAAX protease family)